MVENTAIELVDEKLAVQEAVVTHQPLKSAIKCEDTIRECQQKRAHHVRAQKS